MDKDKKEKVKELSNRQHKIGTASAVVIVMGNRKSIEVSEAERIYGPMKMLRIMDEIEFDMTMQYIKAYGDGLKANERELDIELVRNVGIHAMLFMLSAKYYGFDTCPMHVHSINQLREEFNIPDYLIPVMMITVGKSVDKSRPRGYRKPVSEFVQFNGY